MAEHRTIEQICADAVELLAIIGGMTAGSPGGYIQSRAEAFRREMRRAEQDPALTAALDKISELEAIADERAAMIVAGESERGHLLQTVEVLQERLAEREGAEDNEAPPLELEPVAIFDPEAEAPGEDQPEGPADAQIPTRSGAAGHSVNSVKARRFRLIGVSDGADTGYVDEGTAGELANRNHIGPSTIYKLASNGKVGTRFRVEEVA